jgi:hypothetical protein
MRGEPVLPSKFVSLFDYPLENNSNIEQLRKISIQYDEIEYYSEKFNENILNFNKHLIQSINDINDLLNNSYKRFSFIEQIPQLNNNKKEITDIVDQTTTTDNSHLSQPIIPEILQQDTETDS